ncbi:hypothetical protein DNAOFDDG_02059 [Mannheimia haemolytica]|uniref:Uncharacterized protein n=1 Tax=Mannheimia haemolytica TaxID=75985 RepID=A0A378NC29_MANHA|nr:hypothetical protein MHA_1083 [Mannheimia haemolytica PHL213]TCS83621.1 hypothetical protein EDC41_1494 [Mannheimia haemolytica]STY58705.1 Uncharacterised protein [Mannheimia haemolytica]STY59755.1 Uncharacterised protein [Mannheimia haemolytica]STY65285.1 Uncharacterised protein [Mannheimia haemolytica]
MKNKLKRILHKIKTEQDMNFIFWLCVVVLLFNLVPYLYGLI